MISDHRSNRLHLTVEQIEDFCITINRMIAIITIRELKEVLLSSDSANSKMVDRLQSKKSGETMNSYKSKGKIAAGAFISESYHKRKISGESERGRSFQWSEGRKEDFVPLIKPIKAAQKEENSGIVTRRERVAFSGSHRSAAMAVEIADYDPASTDRYRRVPSRESILERQVRLALLTRRAERKYFRLKEKVFDTLVMCENSDQGISSGDMEFREIEDFESGNSQGGESNKFGRKSPVFQSPRSKLPKVDEAFNEESSEPKESGRLTPGSQIVPTIETFGNFSKPNVKPELNISLRSGYSVLKTDNPENAIDSKIPQITRKELLNHVRSLNNRISESFGKSIRHTSKSPKPSKKSSRSPNNNGKSKPPIPWPRRRSPIPLIEQWERITPSRRQKRYSPVPGQGKRKYEEILKVSKENIRSVRRENSIWEISSVEDQNYIISESKSRTRNCSKSSTNRKPLDPFPLKNSFNKQNNQNRIKEPNTFTFKVLDQFVNPNEGKAAGQLSQNLLKRHYL